MPTQNQIQRQRSLPLSKAVEIAWKSIRQRLSRSLVVTSSIALAIAFLLTILAGEVIVDSMRAWKNAFETSPRYSQILSERQKAEEELHASELALRADLKAAEGAASAGAISAAAAGSDFRPRFGATPDEIKADVGTLPAPTAELSKAVAARAAAGDAFDRWLKIARQLKSLRGELSAPDLLTGRLKSAGVATTADEIHSNRLQTRWVIALALLVAFVGILNAMLMSVTERYREIGTMKCLGALDGFIVKLFLLESIFQGGVGTLLGVVIGVGMSLLAATWSFGSFAWINMPYGQLGVISLICLIVGLILTAGGALYPAWQAARMQPIAAMRVEV